MTEIEKKTGNGFVFQIKCVSLHQSLTIRSATIMSQQELRTYRLSSLQDPTDDMLHAIMEQVGESARRSSAQFKAELHRRFELIRNIKVNS